jgi:CheY-like chemotaxis protein
VDLDSIFFVRTAAGEASQANPQTKMSPAFRRMLRLLDGSRSLADLAPQFPQLDPEDLRLWISELLRQKMIKRAPTLTNSQRMRMRAVTPAAELQVQKIAEEIRPWLANKDNEGAGPRPRPAQLARTARLVAIEARTAADSIGREGFFLDAEPEKTPAGAGPALVLVVEDDTIQAQIIGKFLERDGYKVRLVHNGEQAHAALREQPMPALVLLDVDLPDINGFTLLEQIRTREATQNLRVVMVTGHAERADIAKGVVLGANGYLTKPFRPDMLKLAVARLLAPG